MGDRPTKFPSSDPTSDPSSDPTKHPTENPTMIPTLYPITSNPTESPLILTVNPTRHPSESPILSEQNDGSVADETTTTSIGESPQEQNENGEPFEIMEFATSMNGILSLVGAGVLLLCFLITIVFLCKKSKKKSGYETNTKNKDEIFPQSPQSTEMGTTNKNRTDTLNVYENDD